jgi:hypothetical protein
MIEIKDSAGRTLVLVDAELTAAEIDRIVRQWQADTPQPEVPHFTIAGQSVPQTATIELHDLVVNPDALNRVFRPSSGSARWEGPPPKQRRGRR